MTATHMMTMTAMESMWDTNMFYLDIVSGLGGVALFGLVKDGMDNFDQNTLPFAMVLAVLASRVFVDFMYGTFWSNKTLFGGTYLELLLSSAVWFAIAMFVLPKETTNMERTALLGSTLLVMMATARLTRWG